MFPSSRQSPPPHILFHRFLAFFVRSKKNHPRFVETTTNSGIIASPLLLTFKFKLRRSECEIHRELCALNSCPFVPSPVKVQFKTLSPEIVEFHPSITEVRQAERRRRKENFFCFSSDTLDQRPPFFVAETPSRSPDAVAGCDI